MTGDPEDPAHSTRRRFLVLAGTGVSTALAGCSGRPDTAEYESSGTVDPPSKDEPNASAASAAAARAELDGHDYAVPLDTLALRDHELDVKDDYRGVVIQGSVENTGQQRLELVEVRARVYNTDGEHLGQYLDSTHDLAAGATWSFDVIVLETPSDVGSYDVAVLGSLA